MFKVNQYFDGRVMSIAFGGSETPATVGVMAVGDYEFNSDKPEIMHVLFGTMLVKLPGAENWQAVQAGEKFDVPGTSSFKVRLEEETAYLCEYC